MFNQVKECHQQGAQLTATDGMGWTPLHHAARLDRKEIAQYLVENCESALSLMRFHACWCQLALVRGDTSLATLPNEQVVIASMSIPVATLSVH